MKIKKNPDELEIPLDKRIDLDQAILGSNTQDEFYLALKEMYKVEGDTDIRTKTILPDSMINKIIKLIYWGEEAKSYDKLNPDYPKITDIINNIIIENLYSLKISAKGKGREQFFAALNAKRKEEGKEGLKGLFGLGQK